MQIYKPSELRLFLSSLGVSPKKMFSQNFLIDGNIIRKIVDHACVQEGDVVLEIGPGPGALTEALLERGATVVAVEKDYILADALKRLQTADNRLTVFCQDILEFDIELNLLPLLKNRKAKVIANLPYHLTTPIIADLVLKKDVFSTLCVMVQDEVARRFTASPGHSEYGSFTVFLKFYSNPHYAFHVSRNCFYPIPNVESAVVLIDLKQPLMDSDHYSFFKLTRTSFEHRRKMLRSSLKSLYSADRITSALTALGLNPQARPEELSVEAFIKFFLLLRVGHE